MSSSKSESDIIRDFESDFGSNEESVTIDIVEDEYFGSTPDQDTDNEGNDSDEAIAYADEPLADEEWLVEYQRQNKEREELEMQLKNRLEGTTVVSTWCKCGNCSTSHLQNISECYCCSELDGCGEALKSDRVVEDVGPNVQLKCIIEHPGFAPICLEKWSLRMAADHFKTKTKKRYQQTGSEERFLRSIAYREFSRLVYGFFGKKRIPLPTCACTAIRLKFTTEEEDFTGFDLDESS